MRPGGVQIEDRDAYAWDRGEAEYKARSRPGPGFGFCFGFGAEVVIIRGMGVADGSVDVPDARSRGATYFPVDVFF
jgi:hypothetical protein